MPQEAAERRQRVGQALETSNPPYESSKARPSGYLPDWGVRETSLPSIFPGRFRRRP